jgi:hypothetical protein
MADFCGFSAASGPQLSVPRNLVMSPMDTH